MKRQPQHRWYTSLTLWIFIIGALGIAGTVMEIKTTLTERYDQIAAVNQADAGPFASYQFENGYQFHLVSLAQLAPDGTRSLVSIERPLSDSFRPDKLVALKLPHGDADQTIKVEARLTSPITELFDAAEAADRPLMVSSAYRSIKQQRHLKQEFIDRYGAVMAEEYVAQPRASEHHTGLSVDLSDASTACADDSSNCGLSLATADWLKRNAPRYGFIQRYPPGSQPITGIAHEPWHYRYVGVTLAKQLTANQLTLDEFIRQVQPGLFKQ